MSNRRLPVLTIGFLVIAAILPIGSTCAKDPATNGPSGCSVLIGNYLTLGQNGIAWIVDDSAAFVMNPETNYSGAGYHPSTAAPDGSYHLSRFEHDKVPILLEWGRVGENVVGRISADKEVSLTLNLSGGWPGWTPTFSGQPDGVSGSALAGTNPVHWAVRMTPPPAGTSSNSIRVDVHPGAPVRFAAGLGTLPPIEGVDKTLEDAARRYADSRPHASGDWGDFLGAIADNVNNSRIYSSDNHLLAHTVGRGWAKGANAAPYFCWDSFFTANLAALDDPETARNTVRAILSRQTKEGLVPNYGHWQLGTSVDSTDRSQPPVGSWCVWKIHQRYPDDLDFLREVYPKLVLWHDWWHKARDARQDGLLEWGSTNGTFQGAQFETGWDDNLHYAGARMVGPTMNCYAVDLCALWAQDAHYLALLADTLGKPWDAERFRRDEADMNRRINDHLWSDDLRRYASRYWEDEQGEQSIGYSVFGPGLEAEFFSDDNLQQPVAARHDSRIDFGWGAKPPMQGVGDRHWSARWKGAFTAPSAGVYRFHTQAEGGIRVIVDGKSVIDGWQANQGNQGNLSGDVTLSKGQSGPVVVEYSQRGEKSSLHVTVNRVPQEKGAFLTRLTPMNFYPLISGAPDADRVKKTMAQLTDPKKFWGTYLLPTVAYDDPDWPIQHYWKGKVWGPVNYILWDGIRRYATPAQIGEYADRNVSLFMTNWTRSGVCGENYYSGNGMQSSDPHYTWGALLNLIGLESIVDVDDQGRILLNGAQTKTLELKNIPLLGKRYDVKTAPGSAVLLHDGKVVLEARGETLRADVDDTIGKKP